jgi:hypothetical protein
MRAASSVWLEWAGASVEVKPWSKCQTTQAWSRPFLLRELNHSAGNTFVSRQGQRLPSFEACRAAWAGGKRIKVMIHAASFDG